MDADATTHRTSLVMADNFSGLDGSTPYLFAFCHRLTEPLARVGAVRLVSMTMDYSQFAVHVHIDELNLRFPVFVDRAFDAPLLLAPHVTYERAYGAPLDLLDRLTISIRAYHGGGPPADMTHPSTVPQKARVTMLFAVDHECIPSYFERPAATSRGVRRSWLMVDNLRAATPFDFRWDGPADGPLKNVTRVAVKAMTLSMHATAESFVRLSIPELLVDEWPIPYTSDTIGTYHPYVLMHRSQEYEVAFCPPKAALGSLTVSLTQGNGRPMHNGDLDHRHVFLLLEVDHQASCAADQYQPQPVLSRSLFVSNLLNPDNNRPFSFRHVLDEPCRNVVGLELTQLTCPLAQSPSTALVRLSLTNLNVRWTVPYEIGLYRPQTNVLAVSRALHTADLGPASSFGHLDVLLEAMDPATGEFEPFHPTPGSGQDLCFCLKATFVPPPGVVTGPGFLSVCGTTAS